MNNSKRKIFIAVLFLLIISLLVSYNYLLNNRLNIQKNSKLMASVIGKTNNQKFTKIYEYSTRGSKSNAVQGITTFDNRIYFSTSKSGPSGQKNYYSSIKVYNLKTKKKPYSIEFDKFLSKYPNYSVNDITTDTNVGRNYYLAYSSNKKSKIIFSRSNIIRESNVDKDIVNLAYNSSNKKFYSLLKDKIYEVNIKVPDKNNKSKVVEDTKTSELCNINNVGITIQGITMKGYLLFLAYNKTPSTNVYDNYIDVYDTRNCNDSKVTIKPVQSLKLGKCKTNSGVDNCQIESLSFLGSKMYLAYNNSLFNKVNFYTLSVKNEGIKTSLKAKESGDGGAILTGYAKSSNNRLYSYKFCNNKEGKNCKYKAFKDVSDKEYLTLNEVSMKYKISDVSTDWYFFVKDIFGNVSSAKITKDSIKKVLKTSIIGATSNQKFNIVFSYDTSKENSKALQGISVTKDYIYFSTSTNDKNSFVRSYNRKTKKFEVISDINNILNNNSNNKYKVNDITIFDNNNYYMAYYFPELKAGEKRTSKIIFVKNDITREINMNYPYANIAYRKVDDKFYTTTKDAFYVINIPNNLENNKNVNLGTINPTKKCDVKYSNENISIQGIAFRSTYLLLSPYTIREETSNKEGKTITIKNYIDVFNIGNCDNKKNYKLNPIHTINLGSCRIKGEKEIGNCELESAYFYGSKLYLGYSNSNLNKVNVYTIDMINNKFATSLKLKEGNKNKILLEGTIKDSSYGIYSYKFCKTKDGSNCKYKVYKNEKSGEYINLKKANISYSTNEVNSDWYFFVKDIFGNESSAKLTKEEIEKIIK